MPINVETLLANLTPEAQSAIEAHFKRKHATEILKAVQASLGEGAPAAVTRAPRTTNAPKAEVIKDRWVADKNARRVPDFVLEMTGLSQGKGVKERIISTYGENAVFEKGKPVPPKPAPTLAAAPAAPAHPAAEIHRALAPVDTAAHTVSAKPPKVRKGKK